jgi:hypothetical protein
MVIYEAARDLEKKTDYYGEESCYVDNCDLWDESEYLVTFGKWYYYMRMYKAPSN